MRSASGHPVWLYPTGDPATIQQIIGELHLHPVIAQILVSRGFADMGAIKHHLYAQLPDLHDPFQLTDMRAAVSRVCKAAELGERIVVYGDNDVDGMTGTALLMDFLSAIGANVTCIVPNRTDLTGTMMETARDMAVREEAKLLITVDCGITGAKEIAQVAEKGIDVIVTDHHEPTAKLPLCVATLNPKLVTNAYPNRELTGVGVAFKLAHACTIHLVRSKRIDSDQIDLREYLDLVALGTIADMGSLLDENRILVRYGLRQLQNSHRIGLRKLCEVCELDMGEISAIDVASKIAPRLNSLGRIAEPRKGVRLLLERDPAQAESMAQELDSINRKRQQIEGLMSTDVESTLEKRPEILNDRAIVMDSKEWHPGVIAIVTTRLARTYHRPTLMIAVDGGLGKGSARTIREYPLLPAFKELSDLLVNFGGHDFAAGLTIKADKIPEFRRRFIERANAQLQEGDILSKLSIDAQIDFDQLTFDLMESLSLLEPHGNENFAPVLYCEAVQVRPPKVVANNHLKLFLFQNGRQLEGLGFNMAHRREELRGKDLNVQVAFTPQINRFHNKLSIQLLIRDFKIV
jgi:single-stranded-DNA-specific exonuclease